MRMVIPQFMAVSIGENRGKYGKMMINPYQSDSIGTSIPQKKKGNLIGSMGWIFPYIGL
jgi:hypothetical protein